ncbi:MAG: OmpH family outer membrane protein [Pseudomonadota bacterium]
MISSNNRSLRYLRRRYGLHLGRDGAHARFREKRDARSSRVRKITIALLCTATLGLIGWAGVQYAAFHKTSKTVVGLSNPSHYSLDATFRTPNLDAFEPPMLRWDTQSLERMRPKIDEAARIDLGGNVQRLSNRLDNVLKARRARYEAEREAMVGEFSQPEAGLQQLDREFNRDQKSIKQQFREMERELRSKIAQREAEIITFIRKRRGARNK